MSRLPLEAARVEVASAAAAVFLYLINGGQSIILFAVLLLSSNVAAFAVFMMLRLNRAAHRKKLERDELVGFLYRVLYHYRACDSYMKSAVVASDSIDDAGLREKVSNALRLYLMQGADASSSYANSKCIFGDKNWVASELRKEKRRGESKQADLEESAQRYATFNMFVATVLPSFLVFAFIGSSILSHASFGMLLFSCILLLLIPVFYSAGNVLMWRRLFA